MKDKQSKSFYEFAGFRLDVKKRHLMSGDEIVPLTPKEFKVLLLLIENAERVVEKDELLNAIWKDTYVSVTATGVYYTPFNAQPPFHIKFFDFATRQNRKIAATEKPPPAHYSNLSVSPDGKRILYARQDQSASSIMLAELAE